MISIKTCAFSEVFVPTIFFKQCGRISVKKWVEMVLNASLCFIFYFPLQMIQLTSVLALSVEIAPQACTMASSPVRAARASSSAASATSVCTAAAVTRTARCRASSATAASTAVCSSVCKWEWTAKVTCVHHRDILTPQPFNRSRKMQMVEMSIFIYDNVVI